MSKNPNLSMGHKWYKYDTHCPCGEKIILISTSETACKCGKVLKLVSGEGVLTSAKIGIRYEYEELEIAESP
jgi:hypothetical protein